MALLQTLADQRAMFRLLVRDVSALKPGLTDGQVDLFLNEALRLYALLVEDDDTVYFYDETPLARGAYYTDLTFSRTPLAVASVYLRGKRKLNKRALPWLFSKLEELPNDVSEPEFYGYDAQGDRSVWRFYFDSKSDDDYTLRVWYRIEPVPYAGDASTTPYGDIASDTITTMAAVRAAGTVYGRPPAFVNNLAAGLPERIRKGAGLGFSTSTHGGADSRREP